jgi:hypothetical protein
LQHLREIGIYRRFLCGDLRSQSSDDLVYAAAAFGLQLHRNVAAVGLGHCRKSKLQPSAP